MPVDQRREMVLGHLQRHGEDAQQVGRQAFIGAIDSGQRIVDPSGLVRDQVRLNVRFRMRLVNVR